MTTTIDNDISRLLDKHKPLGAKWVVWIDDMGFRSCYGPFEEYKDATAWAEVQVIQGDVEVLPLYVRDSDTL